MKFSRKMWLIIILKVTKKAGFHPLFRRYISGKTTEDRGGKGGGGAGSNWLP